MTFAMKPTPVSPPMIAGHADKAGAITSYFH
jgi:hypothetical protein